MYVSVCEWGGGGGGGLSENAVTFCHGKNGPTHNLSRGPNMAAIFCLRPNLAARFGPRGQDIAARFGPRTECDSQIWSHPAKCGPSRWDQIWLPCLILGPNLAALM